MQNQVLTFIIFILNGFLIGLLFDIFRVLRKSFKTPDSITYMQDILFWILSGFLTIFTILKFNNGEIRFFIFFGIFLGFSIYMLVFSSLFIKVSVSILTLLKKAFKILFIIPFKFIFSIIYKFIYTPCLKIFKIIGKFVKKMLFSSKNKKNVFFNHIKCKKKKDFV